jgi:bifunctional dethiobiotin synthetase / adenosylmethionine---8-amino-7-oxononanoate aminotransferase
VASQTSEFTGVFYFKPWQTGWPQDSDARTVSQVCSRGVQTATFQAWTEPVSPHRAWEMAAEKGESLSADKEDQFVLNQLRVEVENVLAREKLPFVIVEGAGGVGSPTPQGALQCEAFRFVRMPVVLVGDAALGGISVTLASLEMLETRGYQVDFILLGKGQHQNAEFLKKHLLSKQENRREKTHVLVWEDLAAEESLETWIDRNQSVFKEVIGSSVERFRFAQNKQGKGHGSEGDSKEEMSNRAQAAVDLSFDFKRSRENSLPLWWPFTQHTLLDDTPSKILSAFGDEIHFEKEGALFDANASWWTQCLGHAHPELVQAAARSAGQFGHVMYPGNSHNPALTLAESLLNGAGKGWAWRVFYSDNGSTAVEVALKMAMRLRMTRCGWPLSEKRRIEVLGLKDSYHGDTLGVMEAASPNAFNAKEPWYTGRGHWLCYPRVSETADGAWQVELENILNEMRNSNRGVEEFREEGTGENSEFLKGSLAFVQGVSLFDMRRERTNLAKLYRTFCEIKIQDCEARGVLLGCLLLEPLVHGSSGMIFVDPLFQKILAQVARERGIPVVYDEVFAGLWRLGFESCSDALGIVPDIACYSKCLTGGLVPFGATLASQEVYEAFLSPSKTDALLHGHSYSGYPLGCAVAAKSLELLEISAQVKIAELQRVGEFSPPRPNRSFSSFSQESWKELRQHPLVEKPWAMGTVFSFELKTQNQGYASPTSQRLIQELRRRGIYSRPLGHVIYAMASLSTSPEKCQWLLKEHLAALDCI